MATGLAGFLFIMEKLFRVRKGQSVVGKTRFAHNKIKKGWLSNDHQRVCPNRLTRKKGTHAIQSKDEASAYDVAQLISGSFTSPLYEALWEIL